MTAVILFATGSPILVDVEESLHRAGIAVAAGIQNRDGASYLPDGIALLRPSQITPALRALPFLVPLFTPAHRHMAATEAMLAGLTTSFRLIDPTAAAPRRLVCAEGCYVNAGCSLGSDSEFDRFVFINRGASIGHHARLGAFVSIGPGATLAGHVTVEAGAMVGAGATVLPELTIGANAVVGGGAVVTRDVPAACLVLGNPARIVRREIGGYHGRGVS